MKKLFLIITCFFTIIILVDIKTNLINVYSYSRIELKNPSIIVKKNKSNLSFLLINNSNSEYYIDKIEVIIKDVEKNIICKKMIDVKKYVNYKNYLNITEQVNYDLSDAYSLDYNIY